MVCIYSFYRHNEPTGFRKQLAILTIRYQHTSIKTNKNAVSMGKRTNILPKNSTNNNSRPEMLHTARLSCIYIQSMSTFFDLCEASEYARPSSKTISLSPFIAHSTLNIACALEILTSPRLILIVLAQLLCALFSHIHTHTNTQSTTVCDSIAITAEALSPIALSVTYHHTAVVALCCSNNALMTNETQQRVRATRINV